MSDKFIFPLLLIFTIQSSLRMLIDEVFAIIFGQMVTVKGSLALASHEGNGLPLVSLLSLVLLMCLLFGSDGCSCQPISYHHFSLTECFHYLECTKKKKKIISRLAAMPLQEQTHACGDETLVS